MSERTKKQIAQGHYRTFDLVIAKLEKMGADWADVDECFRGDLYEMAGQVIKLRDEIKEDMELDQ